MATGRNSHRQRWVTGSVDKNKHTPLPPPKKAKFFLYIILTTTKSPDMATYLSVLHLATAGLNGPLLGSDEEEIVLICLVVINIQTNQVK